MSWLKPLVLAHISRNCGQNMKDRTTVIVGKRKLDMLLHSKSSMLALIVGAHICGCGR